MGTVTAKQLHLETKGILDQLEKGERLIITRNGRPVARLEPLSESHPLPWEDLMGEVWRAQARIKPSERVANPVLQERRRRRR
jgi:prevent-host-death family protein